MSHPDTRQPVQMLEPSYYVRAVEFSYRFDTQDADSYATAVMELCDLMAENDALKARVAELQSQVVRIIASKQELIEEYATLRDQLAALSMPVTLKEWADAGRNAPARDSGFARSSRVIASRVAPREPASKPRPRA